MQLYLDILRKIILNPPADKEALEDALSSLILKLRADEKEGLENSHSLFCQLDKHLGGFNPDELVLIGGKKGDGKTRFLVNLCLYFLEKGPVLFFSLQHDRETLSRRFLSAMTSIPMHRLEENAIEPGKYIRYREASQRFNKLPLLIFNQPACTALNIRQKADIREHGQHTPVIVIDSLELLGERGRETEQKALIKKAKELKDIASTLHCPVIVTSSPLSIPGAGKSIKPRMDDFAGIDEHADKVLILFRPGNYGIKEDLTGNRQEEITEVIIAKNNNGIAGTILSLHCEGMTCYKDYKEVNRME